MKKSLRGFSVFFKFAVFFLLLAILIVPAWQMKLNVFQPQKAGTQILEDASSPRKFTIQLFWGKGCSHCEDEKALLQNMKKNYPGMEVVEYEVFYNKQNNELMSKEISKHQIVFAGVPVIVIGNEAFSGYNDNIKEKLAQAIDRAAEGRNTDPINEQKNGFQIPDKKTENKEDNNLKHANSESKELKNPDISSPENDNRSTSDTSGHTRTPSNPEHVLSDNKVGLNYKFIKIPLLGNIDASKVSLPLVTVIIAGIDSFNPCSFFVLLSLLGLLVYARSRGRIALIGSIYIFFSGLIYLLFMVAWLNLFLASGNVIFITKIAGFVSIVIAAINIKDFFFFRKGVSLTIPENAKPKLFSRMRKLIDSTSFVSILMGTVVLSIAANFYELLCSAGFPMLYTRILTLNNLSPLSYYLYLILYNLIYIVPLTVIVILFTVTLGKMKITEWQGRVLKFISGAMMLGLGLILIINPSLLNNIVVSIAILSGAVVIALFGLILIKLKDRNTT